MKMKIENEKKMKVECSLSVTTINIVINIIIL